jgi:hypothetical protein
LFDNIQNVGYPLNPSTNLWDGQEVRKINKTRANDKTNKVEKFYYIH